MSYSHVSLGHFFALSQHFNAIEQKKHTVKC